ncbi:MAG: GNAT family N-acetyltransferase, partial [Kamptonema sp. SIO4C4]|nr:GNAT family N-acetyltransferase [Kamptonema sp. SIO4C4]
DYAWNTLNLSRLISIIAPANVRSQRVAEKVGMQRENATIFKGFAVDIYGISR